VVLSLFVGALGSLCLFMGAGTLAFRKSFPPDLRARVAESLPNAKDPLLAMAAVELFVGLMLALASGALWRAA